MRAGRGAAAPRVAEARASVPGLLLRLAEPRMVVTGSEKLKFAEAWGRSGSVRG